MLVEWIRRLGKTMLPRGARAWLRALGRRLALERRRKSVCIGRSGSVVPISRSFGFDRGLPVDRFYIEKFLSACRQDIRGRTMEIGNNEYTRRFGGAAVARSDVLDVSPDNPKATIVADLADSVAIPGDAFDCIIFTQTLQFIYDVDEAVKTLFRALATDGVLLGTFSGISQISRYDMERWGDYWRFTDLCVKRLFGDVFGPQNVSVQTYGNVLAACAFLQGMSAEELHPRDLEYLDSGYQVIVAVRAVRTAGNC